MMLACVDVDYRGGGALAAALVFEAWTDERATAELTAHVAEAASYEPGAFFVRELPCLLAVLALITAPLDAIIVDGYVWLAEGRAGLGAKLHEALGATTAIVGVAKTAFHGNTVARSVVRGSSARPLYVTSIGMDPDVAAAHVRSMHGTARIPTLLKSVDRASRVTPS
jgi:deoxyribonuclease V